MRSNIRPFKPRQTDAPWRARFLAAVLYLGLAYLLQNPMGGDIGFMVFIALAIIYWVFIHRGTIKVSYFLRYHYLQATMLFLLLFFTFYMLAMLIQFVASGLDLLGLNAVAAPFLEPVSVILAPLAQLTMLVVGVSQAVLALLGKTPRLPVVTPNVVYWA